MNQPPYGMPPGGGGQPPGGHGGGMPPGGHGGGMPPGGHGGMPPGGQGGFNPPYGYGQQPQGGQPPAHYAAPSPPAPTQPGTLEKGFFGGLLDLSFSTFVTTRVIKVLYVLWLLAVVFGALGGLGAAGMAMINGEILSGVFTLVVLPFALVAFLILGRMWHELIIVQFRIAENLDEINKKTRG
jgi:hypothetical protein